MSEGQYSLEVKDYDKNLDLTKLKPYGDTMNDGKVQVSFTLPVNDNERGVEAAIQLAKSMGLKDPNCAHHGALVS
jgi:beta-lysine 5,6-aminomutase beta subunit